MRCKGVRRAALAAAAGLTALALAGAGGCTAVADIGYLAQAANGHLDLLHSARPVADWLADPATPTALRERLRLSQQMRDFAVSELQLPDNRSYRSYADLQRGAAVWNVVAAPELSLTLKTWCFPVMGCVGYRGFFSRKAADALAARLHADGLETSVYGVPAYSTLGFGDWLGGDPLLNTFIQWPDGELAGLIFHELAHQVAYAADDTLFNESFATAVERIGSRRWLAAHSSPAAVAAQLAGDARRQEFRTLTANTRARLQAVYAGNAADAEKRARKAALMAAMRADHVALKAGRWKGYTGYDAWFAGADNAALAVQGAYTDLVPAFERLFDGVGGNFGRFYAEVRRLAALPAAGRRAALVGDGMTTRQEQATVGDIHIERHHALGLVRARRLADDWATSAASELALDCTVVRGDSADVVHFKRPGATGTLRVAADRFVLDAKLNFLLGAFRSTIESEIERNFDGLLSADKAGRSGQQGDG